MDDKIVIKIGMKEIVLDPAHMSFSDVTLSEFFQKSHGYYDYLGRAMADLEAVYQTRKLEYENLASEKFVGFKIAGNCSDKLAEAKVESDVDVVDAKKSVIVSARNLQLVKNHMRAWDKAFENALSLGHMLRKEMEKLGANIRERNTESELNEVFGR